ncbi:MAG: hypothetical protein RIR00_728 [Pseudomonadota bacterium]|jgi:cobalt-zinc-cadmium efflux system outer membrane protein
MKIRLRSLPLWPGLRPLLAPLLALLLTQPAQAAPAFNLEQLQQAALAHNRHLQAGRENISEAAAAIRSAGALPNPEVEYLAGNARMRQPGATPGSLRSVNITQPLDLPDKRAARIGVASAGYQASVAGQQALEAELIAQLRQNYFDLLLREAEVRAAREDQKLIEAIRSRIALRVSSGEAPRYELIKAEAEALNTQKHVDVAGLRVEQSRAQLRQLVGPELAADFQVNGQLDQVPALPDLVQLRDELSSRNPELRRAQAEVEQAGAQYRLEKAQVWPQWAIRAGVDDEPDLRSSRIGVVLTLPLWDRREGPQAEAAARLARRQHELAGRAFALGQALEYAHRQYEITQAQIRALQSGILRQAESALQVAEAAYRFGERGILEVLDAQRVYRAARNELISARYELAAAWIEIERLRAATHKDNP